jgi:hypothetical protein
MQVNNVMVQEISLDESNNLASEKTVRYEFETPKWVIIHRERRGREIGPITLLDEFENIKIRNFEERSLVIDASNPNKLKIHFKDISIIPSGSIYALVIPELFIASHIKVRVSGREIEGSNIHEGSDLKNRLFYFIVFGLSELPYTLDIEARLDRNEDKYIKRLESIEVVEGKKRFEGFSKEIVGQAKSATFWLTLLQIKDLLSPPGQ